VKCSEGLTNPVPTIITRYRDHMQFAAYMAVWFVISFWFQFLYRCVFGCVFCVLLFNYVNYALLSLRLCILIVMYVPFCLFCLCCSVYCLCVNVYRTVLLSPGISYRIVSNILHTCLFANMHTSWFLAKGIVNVVTDMTGYDAVLSCTNLATFYRNGLSPAGGQKTVTSSRWQQHVLLMRR